MQKKRKVNNQKRTIVLQNVLNEGTMLLTLLNNLINFVRPGIDSYLTT